jgi:NAD(P)-dependent dehydrogenase (short-subunit alcohol dehydrogenase family)
MTKTIVITGATDGIGKLTAQMLASQGHQLLLHGRSPAKLEAVSAEIGGTTSESYVADLSRLGEVESLAEQIAKGHDRVDVLINNAGVFKTRQPRTPEGLDVRFVVNTLAPYLLTRRLLSVIPEAGRIVNLSSAAQAPVDIAALMGRTTLDDMAAYAQSKLAITIWSAELAKELAGGPVVVAVNPGSLLASKMVKEGFGVPGKDLSIGADILCRAALHESFAEASGKYFDNDSRRFAPPHAAAQDAQTTSAVMEAINAIISDPSRT